MTGRWRARAQPNGCWVWDPPPEPVSWGTFVASTAWLDVDLNLPGPGPCPVGCLLAGWAHEHVSGGE